MEVGFDNGFHRVSHVNACDTRRLTFVNVSCAPISVLPGFRGSSAYLKEKIAAIPHVRTKDFCAWCDCVFFYLYAQFDLFRIEECHIRHTVQHVNRMYRSAHAKN